MELIGSIITMCYLNRNEILTRNLNVNQLQDINEILNLRIQTLANYKIQLEMLKVDWQSENPVHMTYGMTERNNLNYIHTNDWTISTGKWFLKHCTIKLLSCTIERN